MKKLAALTLTLCLCLSACPALALSSRTVIEPAFPVPDYVTNLLDVARGELGYTEGERGYTKYGEWKGDPYAQWCAEYLCWCVDQVDQRFGTQLLRNVYPLYSGTNTGRDWYIRQGRYVCRWGNVDGWGYQWLKGESEFITTGSYVPQPGDWVFFTWDDDRDTDHVAMVEYCTQDQDGKVTIHVLEGNAPSAVQRQTYDLTYSRILGFGTVHDVMDITMRSGCSGVKVQLLQDKLAYLGYLPSDKADGRYGTATAQAVNDFQKLHGLKTHGIANIATQYLLDEKYQEALDNDPATWTVIDDE
ncbi:MAG: peptidoglycan-binding protein [Clostridia bacterium]|nr:peptidoglycan-binding protein [Clostridia bacterium]